MPPSQQGKAIRAPSRCKISDKLIATKHEPWPYNGNASEKIVDAILDEAR